MVIIKINNKLFIIIYKKAYNNITIIIIIKPKIKKVGLDKPKKVHNKNNTPKIPINIFLYENIFGVGKSVTAGTVKGVVIGASGFLFCVSHSAILLLI